MAEFENPSLIAASTGSGATTFSSANPTSVKPVEPVKKKRNLPGMPDPGAEVIALSPKTLMATNRFVCEICNKGFQRDQNLQLHRRGHNMPWKLRKRSSKDVIRKRVYVCPEPTCVHHNPTRALGDLTGIKKHFCRKHGEKKWKCERCSKMYAVQSDWKAHKKTCGTKEYKCYCGTLFSRRDSFITHRAFCDVLAEESARAQRTAIVTGEDTQNVKPLPVASPPLPHTPSATNVVSPVLSIQSSELPENPIEMLPPTTAATVRGSASSISSGSNASVFASIFASSTQPSHSLPSSFSNCPNNEPTSLSLFLYNGCSSLFSTPDQDNQCYTTPPQPVMSATALLQKAAQMGATTSNASYLRGFGLALSSPSSSGQQENPSTSKNTTTTNSTQWSSHIRAGGNSPSLAAGLGLALPSGANSGLKDLMMGPSWMLNTPTTLDLFGLGVSPDGASTSGLSALLASFGGSRAAQYGGENSQGQ